MSQKFIQFWWHILQNTLWNISQNTLWNTSCNILQNISQNTLQNTSWNTSQNISQNTSQNISWHISQNISRYKFCSRFQGTSFTAQVLRYILQNILRYKLQDRIFLPVQHLCHQMTLNVKVITFIPLVCINIRTTLKKIVPKIHTIFATHFEHFMEHFQGT